MPVDVNRFKTETKQILERRANSTCSNPFCRKATSGAHSSDTMSINVGEAAHIKGANEGSARYDAEMTSEQRSSIINAIWLCRTCAGLVDRDEDKFSVELLYSWKRGHELSTSEELEGSKWRRNLLASELGGISNHPVALQIALDKPPEWEYLFTVELLKSKMNVIKRRYVDLEAGVVFRPTRILSKDEYRIWCQEKITDMLTLTKLFNVVINERLSQSWGSAGEPGDVREIVQAVQILEEGAMALLEWEVDLNFTVAPDIFEKVSLGMKGWTLEMFAEISRIETEISKILDSSITPTGVHEVTLTLKAPQNIQQVYADFEAAIKKLY